MCGVMVGLWWDDENSKHIRCRSLRYPGATDIEPAWTLRQQPILTGSPVILTLKSRLGHIRVVGHSPTAGFVITVIIDPADHSGVTAWRTSGAELRAYRGERQ